MPVSLARRYAARIDVVREDGVPAQFVWRGRLYVVREVQAHWFQTGPWWRSAAVTGLTAGDELPAGAPGVSDDLVLAPIPASPKWAQRAWGEPAPDLGASVGPAQLDDDEREYWRVEAAAGRSRAPVVVELCFAWQTGAWTVSTVFD